MTENNHNNGDDDDVTLITIMIVIITKMEGTGGENSFGHWKRGKAKLREIYSAFLVMCVCFSLISVFIPKYKYRVSARVLKSAAKQTKRS